MKLPRAVAQALQDAGTTTLFGVMGGDNLGYINDWEDAGLTYVRSVGEAGAVGMADGFARMSGGLGVVTVSQGAAVTNALTALTEAVRAGSRVLMLTSDAADFRHNRHKVDIRGVANVAGAEYRRVAKAQDVVDDIALAGLSVVAERRPIVLDIPDELLRSGEVDYARSRFRSVPSPTAELDDDAWDTALGIVLEARRPLVLAGRGAYLADARRELCDLADTLGAPVATTLLGREMFRGEPYDIGICGTVSHSVALDVINRADCILAFGASLNGFTTLQGRVLAGKRVVQCDIDPSHINRFSAVDVGIVGDVKVVARSMARQLAEVGHRPSGFRTPELRATLASRPPNSDFTDRSPDGLLDMRTASVALNQLLPPERVVVTDGGRFQGAVWPYMQVQRPTDFHHTVHFAGVGLGTGVGLGASIACRDRLTVTFVGDGGGAMAMMEFVTAVREHLPFLLVVYNDGAYGAEYNLMRDAGIDTRSSLMTWPDFSDVGAALGGYGLVARNLGDLVSAAEMVKQGTLPLILDVKCDPAIDLALLSS